MVLQLNNKPKGRQMPQIDGDNNCDTPRTQNEAPAPAPQGQPMVLTCSENAPRDEEPTTNPTPGKGIPEKEWKLNPDFPPPIVVQDADGNRTSLYPVIESNVDFGSAVRALKDGKFVTRAGWNGRGMYLWLLPATKVKAEWCKEPHLKQLAEDCGGEIEALGSIRMLTADRKVLTGWLASQTDILAEDWQIIHI